MILAVSCFVSSDYFLLQTHMGSSEEDPNSLRGTGCAFSCRRGEGREGEGEANAEFLHFKSRKELVTQNLCHSPHMDVHEIASLTIVAENTK